MNKETTKRKILWLAVIPLLAASLWSLQGCDYSYLDGMENFQDYTCQPVVALPLVSSSLGIDDIIDLKVISGVEIGDDDLITLVYRGEIFSVDAADIVSVPNQEQTLQIGNITPAGSGSITLPAQSHVFLMTFPGEEVVTSISFLSGFFNVSATSDMLAQDGYTMNATFRILNSDNGEGQSIGGAVSLDSPAQINLAGSRIDAGNSSNFFLVEYTITISGNGTPSNAPYTINLEQSITNISFDMLMGYVDQIDFLIGSSSIPITLFKNSQDASIAFAQPTIDFIITNSFGTPLNVNVTEAYATMPDESIVNITGDGIELPWPVDYNTNHQNSPPVTHHIVDNANTNLFDITMDGPTEMFFNFRGLLNPDDDGQPTNWVRHNSNMTIDVEVSLPLYGRVDYFNVQDTTELTIDSIPEEIEWMELKLMITNEFPLGINLNVLMLDENNTIIDTLFVNNGQILEPAPVDPVTHITREPAVAEIIEMIDLETAENLRLTKRIIMKAQMKTWDQENGTPVKILDTYRLGIDMGVRAKAKIEADFGN